ncbi:MAG: XdhC family protein [Candidatus Marinimicrobia bacterium]|nr:XdhC family protein [Candidatus Neomarinimicrobiota bacterium]
MKNIYNEILELNRGKGAGVLVTVVLKTGSGPVGSGARMLVYPDGSILGTVGGGTIEKLAIEKARNIYKTHENCLEEFTMSESASDGTPTGMLCGGTATLFFEYFAPKNHLYIFGAGHVGKALVYHLRNLDYFVTVIDDRKEVLEKISGADKKRLRSFETALSDKDVVENSYIIIATYKHKYDSLILKRIYKSDWNPKYIGMVSSRRKQEIILNDLKSEVKNANMELCFIPVGLDIGGSSPDEIALSIIAEIQAVRYGKSGGYLRDKN